MADSEDHRNRSLKPERPDPTPESEKHNELDKKRDRKKKHKHRRRDSSSDDEDYSSSSSESEDDRRRSKGKKRGRSRNSRRRRSRSESDSEEDSSSDSESDSESDRRRERRRRREKDERRRREKEKERRKRKKDKKEKKKKKEKGNKGAVTNSWGKYGIIRESDMWNKRPEFTAWLLEIKQVNMEALSNWEEKQMFKEFMEDHNTATFPSKKYYNLEAYHHHELEKEMKKGLKKLPKAERTIFNDEEQRRLELMREREKQKEAEVEVLKQSMQSGMAQAMKEQARLREEMILHFRLGNHEAAAAIQKRLDPDPPM